MGLDSKCQLRHGEEGIGKRRLSMGCTYRPEDLEEEEEKKRGQTKLRE